ncbi:ATP dependent RNA helicase [Candidatus Mancarchaeum acidiphilum]|uniref:ATP dependent RNA helicase n=1 Tax=Candidatus Mancarchaeum acidiphilum TaxID=1920749 RepID=A0A218NM58_9ARCH|nr:DEAD/DEAH box helicase [Candidatus Mancarchaeum acidiphilum]ASI13548.1 ATP dependent RNA helicase [Candidatus Mancarchaeum acidiphilum]
MTLFEELGIEKTLVDKLNAIGIVDATEVQKVSIPIILAGKDVVVRSKTGSGKTYAFVLPILNKLSGMDYRNPVAIVLAPTRELAMQTYKAIENLGDRRFKPVVVYGGVSINPQINGIKNGCNIVIGTPGRLLDIMDRGVLKLDNIKYAVIDEADDMLNMGFIEDVNRILSATKKERQTMLFSATIPRELNSTIHNHTTEPEFISIGGTDGITVKTIDHSFYLTRKNKKFQTLLTYLKENNPGKTIVFSRTKSGADLVCEALKEAGVNSMLIHGGLTQDRRERVLNNFKVNGEVLVTTDVLARGIDIKDIQTIINYDLPEDTDVYVHRVGRSARMGKSGKAFNIVSDSEEELIQEIENKNKIKMNEIVLHIDKYANLASESIEKAMAKSKRKTGFRSARGSSERPDRYRRNDSRSKPYTNNNKRHGKSGRYVYGN